MIKYVYEIVVRSCWGEEYVVKSETTDVNKHVSNRARTNSDLAHMGASVVKVNHDGVLTHE